MVGEKFIPESHKPFSLKFKEAGANPFLGENGEQGGPKEKIKEMIVKIDKAIKDIGKNYDGYAALLGKEKIESILSDLNAAKNYLADVSKMENIGKPLLADIEKQFNEYHGAYLDVKKGYGEYQKKLKSEQNGPKENKKFKAMVAELKEMIVKVDEAIDDIKGNYDNYAMVLGKEKTDLALSDLNAAKNYLAEVSMKENMSSEEFANVEVQFNDYSGRYAKAKKDYADYLEKLKSEQPKNDAWKSEAQEMIAKLTDMYLVIFDMAGADAALKIPGVKNFLDWLIDIKNGIESSVANDNAADFQRYKNVFNLAVDTYNANAATFPAMCTEFKESDKIMKAGPIALISDLGDPAKFKSAFSGIVDYIAKHGIKMFNKTSATLYFANGVQLDASYLTSEEGPGLLYFEVRIDGVKDKLSFYSNADGKTDVFPPSGLDALDFLNKCSDWKNILPPWLGILPALNKAKEKMDIEFGEVQKFAQRVLSELKSLPEFSSLSGFKLPEFEFCRDKDMPPSSNNLPAAGAYLHEEYKILINYEYYSGTSWLKMQTLICHELGHAFQYYRKPYWVEGYVVPDWVNERATDIFSVDAARVAVGPTANVTPGENGFSGYSPSKALWVVHNVVGAEIFDLVYLNGNLRLVAEKFCMEKRGNADPSTLKEFYDMVLKNTVSDAELAIKLENF
ncbi:MAG: hypothetical protein NTV88_00290 [Candidatus Micrarchaeota archaeon]|nr:hypothetical protein [Candidatus Micrarchaeota archaeon]